MHRNGILIERVRKIADGAAVAAWLRVCAMIPSLSPRTKAETKRLAERCDGIAGKKALEQGRGKGQGAQDVIMPCDPHRV
jgi:hypothetical protein